jgi:hypothetical protein
VRFDSDVHQLLRRFIHVVFSLAAFDVLFGRVFRRKRVNQRRKDRLDDAERVSRAVEDLPGGMAQAASKMIGVRNCTDL